MAYKNKADQAKSSNRHYHRNKEDIIRKNRLRKTKTLDFIRQLKSHPCTDCGGVFHPSAMDFDHVKSDKLKSISAMVCFSNEKILKEIEKCELVCANCHRLRTFNRWQLKK